MVDLSKAKRGDNCVTRGGMLLTFLHHTDNQTYYPYVLYHNGDPGFVYRAKNGQLFTGETNKLDIIKIKPNKEFEP